MGEPSGASPSLTAPRAVDPRLGREMKTKTVRWQLAIGKGITPGKGLSVHRVTRQPNFPGDEASRGQQTEVSTM